VHTRTRVVAAGLACLVLASCRARLPGSDALEQQIRSILELPTYEQLYRDIVYVDRERSFLLFRTMHAQVLFSVDIRVQAGIDLATGLSIRPEPEKGVVTVRLPAAKILLVDADEATIRQYFVKESGGSIDRLEYYDEIARAKALIAEDAIDREILAKATTNARSLISGLLSSAGYTEVRFAP
jgi:hypothetical protein